MKTPWGDISDDPVGYARSFLVVIGMFCSAALLIGFARRGWSLPPDIGLFQICMLSFVAIIGVSALWSAFTAADTTVEHIADTFSHHEICVVFLVVAWPMHMILREYWKRK